MDDVQFDGLLGTCDETAILEFFFLLEGIEYTSETVANDIGISTAKANKILKKFAKYKFLNEKTHNKKITYTLNKDSIIFKNLKQINDFIVKEM
ncbi:MAG: hypothetical protein AMQ22_00576 [Candidatus Methanofastidiosum methylothiophilum]|uniref:Sugar-specific transcriptional regulator TrmB n=1 Tax=Candidatus Methanofastidiosum methylothiophilum TaxID=1705564 RepID=A0A150J6N9_9EURY|nr:MAG: hypothetical protein AMQ22_00576 [Candidatus Methanofastidiosum methylthiophilus]